MFPWPGRPDERLQGRWGWRAGFATGQAGGAVLYHGSDVPVEPRPPHQVPASLIKLYYAQVTLMHHPQKMRTQSTWDHRAEPTGIPLECLHEILSHLPSCTVQFASVDSGTVHVPIGMYSQQLLEGRGTYTAHTDMVHMGRIGSGRTLWVCGHAMPVTGAVVAKFHPLFYGGSIGFLSPRACF